ncbi:MAG: hypothetical protein P8X74_10900 [Reinekea sp.]|jgi:hypothetical protein
MACALRRYGVTDSGLIHTEDYYAYPCPVLMAESLDYFIRQ